ncbi:hypothetical protein [Guptibacillus hwajinpoensis]|uniref:hypothetical protein n=1 Tax=Guptibacillus hwajinpoensis TaxID=208199 RepID=UPI003D04BC3F
MSRLQMDSFYQKLNDLESALNEAETISDPHDSCKILSPRFFGGKFPIPVSKEARYKQVGLSSAPSSSSARGI